MVTAAKKQTVVPPVVSRSSPISTITIGAVGDCALGTDARFSYQGSFSEMYDGQNPAYFFSGVKEVLAGNDLTLANLETTLTYAATKAEKSFQGNQAFFFQANPEYVNILLESGIDAVNIANNHSLDFGSEGMQETLQTLTNAGIGWFGYDGRYIMSIKGVKVGLLGRNDLGPLEEGADISVEKWYLNNDIKYLRKQGCAVVITYFHWGLKTIIGLRIGKKSWDTSPLIAAPT